MKVMYMPIAYNLEEIKTVLAYENINIVGVEMIAKNFRHAFCERGKEHTMGKYFGTDGFRGEANIDLTVEHAYKVGRFLGWYFGKDHKAQIVIGKDTRRSSYMFEYSLVAGLTASGADAYLLHVTTTPSVSYVVRTENLTAEL